MQTQNDRLLNYLQLHGEIVDLKTKLQLVDLALHGDEASGER